MNGLSVANNLLANTALLNLDNNQKQYQNAVEQLSTGLRINTAADDPSGLAIAERLQSQVVSFQQSSQNVQNGANAATTALLAMTAQLNILTRIRALAIEASSDLASNPDRQELQAEVDELIAEVNRISDNTTFNGVQLLDGSHAGYQPEQNAYVKVTANSVLATNGNHTVGLNLINYGLLVATVGAGGAGFNTTPNVHVPGIQGLGGHATVDGTIILQVVNTGPSIAVQETFIQSDNGFFSVSRTLFGPHAANASQRNISGLGLGDKNGFDNVKVVLGTITTLDAGATAYIKISQNVPEVDSTANPAFTIHTGPQEGDEISFGIQATNAQQLRISNISVISTGINLVVSPQLYQSFQSEDAIGQLDNAIDMLLAQQATVAAVVERLNVEGQNDDTAATNLQAAESTLRDANIGQEVTQFVKSQVLTQMGEFVVTQSNANAQSVLTLFR